MGETDTITEEFIQLVNKHCVFLKVRDNYVCMYAWYNNHINAWFTSLMFSFEYLVMLYPTYIVQKCWIILTNRVAVYSRVKPFFIYIPLSVSLKPSLLSHCVCVKNTLYFKKKKLQF